MENMPSVFTHLSLNPTLKFSNIYYLVLKDLPEFITVWWCTSENFIISQSCTRLVPNVLICISNAFNVFCLLDRL